MSIFTQQAACSVVAVLLHYLYLVSFMWMLMEGVVLYVLLVKVFIQKTKKLYLIIFTVLSYGEIIVVARNGHNVQWTTFNLATLGTMVYSNVASSPGLLLPSSNRMQEEIPLS